MMLATRLGRYELLEELGRGAMGVVHRALDPQAGRLVAIKTMVSPQAAAERGDYERFLREARSLLQLRHRNIVTMHELGDDDGTPFIAMELLEGTPLDRLMASGTLPPLSQRLEWVAQLCDGLDYAHWAGVVHRDVKPANLFMTIDGTLKILDFGIAKLAASSIATRTGTVIGTVDYMSPEQVLAERELDGRSDLFSAGVLLYELIFGQRPFSAEHMAACMYRIVNAPPPAQPTYESLLGPELGAVLQRALQKQPDGRFETGAQMAQAIRIAAEHLHGAAGEAVVRAIAAAGTPKASFTRHAVLSTAPLSLGTVPSRARHPRRIGVWLLAAAGVVLVVTLGRTLLDREPTPSAIPLPIAVTTTPTGENPLGDEFTSAWQPRPLEFAPTGESAVASAPLAAARAPEGRLGVAVAPWARVIGVVSADGVTQLTIGDTTPALLTLPAGRWRLRLSHPSAAAEFTVDAEVVAGQLTTIRTAVPGLDLRHLAWGLGPQ